MSENGIDPYLEQSPDSAGRTQPLVETAPQKLNFLELGWENFERLCYRLVRRDATVQHTQRYGEPGQQQAGIDLFARHKDGTYTVHQCKRVEDLPPAKIRGAVDRFVNGQWYERADTLVLCTAASMAETKRAEEIEKQAARLKQAGKRLETWDRDWLSAELKTEPELVTDFFGLPIARQFCPALAGTELGRQALPQHVARTVEELKLPPLGDFGELTLRELVARAASSAAPTTAPAGSVQPVSGALEEGVEELLSTLDGIEPASAARLRELVSGGGTMAVAKMIRAHEEPQADDSLELLVTASRIAAHEGLFGDARDGFLRASRLPGLDDHARARQLARAAGMSQAIGDMDEFGRLLEQARELDASHPAIAIAEARASDDPEYVLQRLVGVEPESKADEALLHVTLAQAHLAREDVDAADRELTRARSADPDGIAVRECEAIAILVAAQLRVRSGLPCDPAALRRAAEAFAELRQGLDTKRRWSESARIAAREAEALSFAEDFTAAVEVLQSIRRAEELDSDALSDVGRSAMIARRPDLVLDLLPESPAEEKLRLIRADALAMSESAEARDSGVATLRGLLDSGDPEIAESAAFGVLAAASVHKDVRWNDEAAEVLRTANPAGLVMLKAEHQRLQGDIEAAEKTLLPHAGDLRFLRRLRDYAAQRSDWETAKDRSRAVLREPHTAWDRLLDAEILRHAGERSLSETRFLQLAHDDSAPAEARDSAFRTATAMAMEDRDYGEANRRADAWFQALPGNVDAVWTLLVTLIRRHKHEDAYRLLKEAAPKTDNPERAHIAAEILYRAAPAAEAIERLDALSAQFDRREEPLEGLLIATALNAEQEQVALPDHLQNIVRDALQRFPERFPESTVIRAVKAPETAEELDALVRELQGDNARAQQDVLKQITDGQVPVHAFASLAPSAEGVAGTWCRLNALPLGFGYLALDEHEKAAAREALGSAAVWDASALFIAGGLGDGFAGQALNALPGSFVANSTVDDAESALIGPQPVGERLTIGYNPDADRAFVEEVPEQVVAREQACKRGVRELTTRFIARSGIHAGSDKQLVEILDDEGTPRSFKVLVETLMLAEREKRPLYADDRRMRLMAREMGIVTFGSVSLIAAMTETALLTEQRRSALRRKLAASGAWGLQLTGAELVDEGQRSKWDLSPALAGAFNDRAAWRAQPATTADALLEFLAAVHEHAPEKFQRWFRRAMDAGTRALPELHPGLISQTMMVMAIGFHRQPADRLPTAFVHALTREVRALPTQYRTPGWDPVLGAVDRLLGHSDQESQHLRFGLLCAILRRLPGPEQSRAWTQFVRITN